MKYLYIKEPLHECRLVTMCPVLRVARAGSYKWLHQPVSSDDETLVDSLVPPGHASTSGYTDPRILYRAVASSAENE